MNLIAVIIALVSGVKRATKLRGTIVLTVAVLALAIVASHCA